MVYLLGLNTIYEWVKHGRHKEVDVGHKKGGQKMGRASQCSAPGIATPRAQRRPAQRCEVMFARLSATLLGSLVPEFRMTPQDSAVSTRSSITVNTISVSPVLKVLSMKAKHMAP